MLNNSHLFRFKKLIIFYAIVNKHYKTIPLSFEKPDLKFFGIFNGAIRYSYQILPSVVLLIVHFAWPRVFRNNKITQRRSTLQYSFLHFPLYLELVLAFLVCSSHVNDLATSFHRKIYLHCRFLNLVTRKKYLKWAHNCSLWVFFTCHYSKTVWLTENPNKKSFLISSKNFLI